MAILTRKTYQCCTEVDFKQVFKSQCKTPHQHHHPETSFSLLKASPKTLHRKAPASLKKNGTITIVSGLQQNFFRRPCVILNSHDFGQNLRLGCWYPLSSRINYSTFVLLKFKV